MPVLVVLQLDFLFWCGDDLFEEDCPPTPLKLKPCTICARGDRTVGLLAEKENVEDVWDGCCCWLLDGDGSGFEMISIESERTSSMLFFLLKVSFGLSRVSIEWKPRFNFFELSWFADFVEGIVEDGIVDETLTLLSEALCTATALATPAWDCCSVEITLSDEVWEVCCGDCSGELETFPLLCLDDALLLFMKSHISCSLMRKEINRPLQEVTWVWNQYTENTTRYCIPRPSS